MGRLVNWATDRAKAKEPRLKIDDQEYETMEEQILFSNVAPADPPAETAPTREDPNVSRRQGRRELEIRLSPAVCKR